MTAVTEPLDGLPIAGAIHRSREAFDLRGSMSDLSVDHEVDADGTALDGFTVGRRIGDVTLAFVRYGAPVRVLAWATGDKVCWTVPIGPMGVRVGGTENVLGSGFLLDPRRTTVMHPHPEQGALVVTTGHRTLTDRFEALSGRRATEELAADPFASALDVGQVEHAVRYVSSVLASTPEPSPALVQTLQDCLVTAILLEAPTNYARLLRSNVPSSPQQRHVDRAREWAEARLDQDFDMAAWAEGTGVSVRHLQKLVRDTADCTPWDLVTRMRLERARSLLRSGGCESVTEAALSVGFGHLGRFAGKYRDAFGVLPSQELAGGE